jgi:cyanophycinase
MPAPIPPGYTRGPIVWIGAGAERGVAERLHQWLWREAGGYGARLVLLTAEAAHVASVASLYEQMAAWECDHLTQIIALDRRTARATNDVATNDVATNDVAIVEQATGIVLVGDDPLWWAATLGGTPIAQAIRRANARSKLVAGIGAVGAFLCQHIISAGHNVTTLRGAVTFGPGLGLVNRLVVDATAQTDLLWNVAQRRLVAAVATNPYLIGVGLNAGSAAILYPDNTLQASGPNPLTVVDGQAIEAADLDLQWTTAEEEGQAEQAVVGARHYTLPSGAGFNLDNHTLRPAGEIDLPPTGQVTSVF